MANLNLGDYLDEARAWYERKSVWAAGAIGFGVGLLVTAIF